MKFNNVILLVSLFLLPHMASAHGPLPAPLTGVEVPPVPGLLDGDDPIVVDKQMAIALGKALFWDINVGSDGMACGSCHFHAGADARIKNQLNPGDKSSAETGRTFEPTLEGQGGPNYTLTKSDFPFHKYNNPLNRSSGVAFSSDDVVASSGTFSGQYRGTSRTSGSNDNCNRAPDSVFNVNGTGTRRVEPRNAPTVINSIFNHRNFWDGRANNIFNGSSPWGDRDPEAGVWVKVHARKVEKQRLRLENSSLASLSVGPPLSDTEMSCEKRTIPDIGRKLLSRRPLQYQKVHANDSVFGPLNMTRSTLSRQRAGLNTTYREMIKKAFNDKYWSYNRTGEFGRPAGQSPYNQVEANFAMFFGIALQLYQSTLVSDQALIDTCPRDANFFPDSNCIGESASRGVIVYFNSHCNLCHAGSTLTTAAITTNAMIISKKGPEAFGKEPIFGARHAGINQYSNVVMKDSTFGGAKLLDFGFANTGVANPQGDPGLGGEDDFGNPLSFAAQYVEHLMGNDDKVLDASVKNIRACDFNILEGNALAWNVNFPMDDLFTLTDGIQLDPNGASDCANQDFNYIPTIEAAIANKESPKLAISTQAAFKVPTLRNIELTGPFMHNGSMATLEQVIEFYARGGNFPNNDLHNLINGAGISGNSAIAIRNRADLLALLKTFTDERVRYERAPFDHPELLIPNGHVGNHEDVAPNNRIKASLAKDEMMLLPAVGADGSLKPIQTFADLLPTNSKDD
jgi:cytochrome c peroxidase